MFAFVLGSIGARHSWEIGVQFRLTVRQLEREMLPIENLTESFPFLLWAIAVIQT